MSFPRTSAPSLIIAHRTLASHAFSSYFLRCSPSVVFHSSSHSHFIICLLSLSHFRVFIHSACQQFARLSFIPYALFSTCTRRLISRYYSPPFLALLLLADDIGLNPGPSNFCLCTLNIRSILHPLHTAALSDIIETHHPNSSVLLKPGLNLQPQQPNLHIALLITIPS